MVTNGYAVRVYGLILCQDEATACTDLLEALLAHFKTISDRNLRKNIEIQDSRKKSCKKTKKSVEWGHILCMYTVGFPMHEKH